jgi:triacylglycerol lipase
MYFPKGFDLDRAIELGELVNQAYKQFEAFYRGEPWKLPAGFTLVKELNCLQPAKSVTIQVSGFFVEDLRGARRAGNQKEMAVPIGFIARRKGCAFLIFRGTVTDHEWFHNLLVRLTPYPIPGFGNVHDGFLQTYTLFQKEIEETLGGMDSGTRLFVAGHSLGAALATIALPDIEARMGWDAAGLYTYGSPRIGDNAFVAAFNRRFEKESFRIENTSDMVGAIPPPAPIAGKVGGFFSHVETPVAFTVQAEDLVKNHDIGTYISALKDARTRRGIIYRIKSWLAGLRAQAA